MTVWAILIGLGVAVIVGNAVTLLALCMQQQRRQRDSNE